MKISSPHQYAKAVCLGNEEVMPRPSILPITRSEGQDTNVGRTQRAYKATPARTASSYKAITNLKEYWLTKIADPVSGVPPMVPPL